MAAVSPSQVVLKDSTPITIRSALESDAGALAEFARHGAETSEHNVTQPDELDTDPDKERAWAREHLDRPGHLALAALAPSGALVGLTSFKTHRQRRVRHHGHFGITVHADWRGRGVGRAMLEALISWARAHEFIERVDLGVFEPNAPARALYTSLGFVEVGRREREFRLDSGEYVDDVQMSLWVKRTMESGKWE